MRALGLLTLFCCGAASAAVDPELAVREREHAAVQVERAQLETRHAETEAAHRDALERLAQTERRLSSLARELARIEAAQQPIRDELERLAHARAALAARIDELRAALAQWLRNYYMRGEQHGVMALLAATNPNQMARNAYYLERLGRERLQLIARLRDSEAEYARLLEAADAQRVKLAALHQTVSARREDERRARVERAAATKALSEHLAEQQGELVRLKASEARLSGVISQLREAAAAARAAALARAEAQARAGDRAPATADSSALMRRTAAVQLKPFDRLRGTLRYPVEGELSVRFGARKKASGQVWQGLFFSAEAGKPVLAVADGQVVYADWLRGLGNIVIVDHDNGFLTVYGYNDVLLRESGEWVLGGDVLARVGGGPETGSGLYFEIRRDGMPVDPSGWLKR